MHGSTLSAYVRCLLAPAPRPGAASRTRCEDPAHLRCHPRLLCTNRLWRCCFCSPATMPAFLSSSSALQPTTTSFASTTSDQSAAIVNRVLPLRRSGSTSTDPKPVILAQVGHYYFGAVGQYYFGGNISLNALCNISSCVEPCPLAQRSGVHHAESHPQHHVARVPTVLAAPPRVPHSLATRTKEHVFKPGSQVAEMPGQAGSPKCRPRECHRMTLNRRSIRGTAPEGFCLHEYRQPLLIVQLILQPPPKLRPLVEGLLR